MPQVNVSNACTGCQICTKVCPVNVFIFNIKANMAVASNDANCISCGHCLINCPANAITVAELACEPLAKTTPATPYAALTQTVLKRRSVRLFLQKPVPKSCFDELIDTACYAPTARNSQGVHWTVVLDPQKVRHLSALAVDWFRENGITALVEQWEAGYDIINRHAPHLVVTHSDDSTAKPVEDAAIALTTFELLASAKGLGTCWAGFFMTAARDYPPLHEALELPLGHKARGALMVGYAAVKPHKIPVRKPNKVSFI